MFQLTVRRRRQANHVRCQERRDDTDRYHHRIQVVADNAQRQSQRCDDKRELTNLRHRESAAHGRFQRFTTQHKRQTAQRALSDEDGQHQCDDRQCIFHQDVWVNQHTY